MRRLSRAATAGYGAPALKGKTFNRQWDGKKLSDFYGYVHTDMPLGLGASLPSQEYADIVAFLLAQSGLPAGTDKFTPYSPMDRVSSSTRPPAAPWRRRRPVRSRSASCTASSRSPRRWRRPRLSSMPRTRRPTTGTYNKGYRGERYSTLAQIDRTNAGSLRPVCMFQLGELGHSPPGR